MLKAVTLVFLFAAAAALSQNLQVHYDYGKGRNYITTTIEMFKPDEYGATFFFVDMDYDTPGTNSMSLGYWEIARYVSLPFCHDLSATVQYNDGAAIFGPLGRAWFVGLSYPVRLGFITVNTDVLYADFEFSKRPDFQLTFVWFKLIFNERVQLTGYADIWTHDDALGKKQPVVQTEPQIWYLLDKHLAVGGEVEISKNFLPAKGWQLMPTVGIKWEF